MPGIPGPLTQKLKTTLLRCAPVDSDRALHAVFVDARIAAWRDALPEAASRKERVQAIIDELSDAANPAGENALSLLLQVLSDNTPPGDACHGQLAALANEITAALAHEPAPEASADRGATPATPGAGSIHIGGNVHGDVVLGTKITGTDQRGQTVDTQTNIASDLHKP